MFILVEKPTKKGKQKKAPQTEPETTPKIKNNKKPRKVVRAKVNDEKKSKPELKSEDETHDNGGLKDKKKLEAKVPVDARVIDRSYEEPVPAPEITKAEPVKERDERINYLTGKGTQHPVHEQIQDLRNLLLNSGFNELENPFFVAEKDIFKQHNINPNLVFDRIYHLAESQRPEIELEPNLARQLNDIVPSINLEKLNELLNEYRDHKIENYQVIEKIMTELNLSRDQINKIFTVIPELNENNPKLTNITLRSTMDSSWFTTLAAIMDKENLPIKIFSTGIWFKRGTKLDELNLSSHYGTSCIIIDEHISVNNGKVIAEEILNRLKFKELKFKENEQNRNFNVTVDEIGIFVNGIEIATCGLFANEILNKYGIDLPTLYINFGLEHMVMVQKGIDDIRELMFPQFYKAWKFNDNEIAGALQFISKPKTELGKVIAKNLVKVCEKNGNIISPCEFTVWEGPVKIKPTAKQLTSVKIENNAEKRLSVKVVKREKDSKLCGPAYLNEIIVKNGDIYGLLNNDQNSELTGAFHTKICYLDAFSKLVGSTIERKLTKGTMKDAFKIEIGIIKEMDDINLQLDGGALRYILTNNKKIDVRGPLFVNVECYLEMANEKKLNIN